MAMMILGALLACAGLAFLAGGHTGCPTPGPHSEKGLIRDRYCGKGTAPMEAAAMEYVASGGAETLSREQFDEFYKRTTPALRANITGFRATPAAADDFLQEACMRMLDAPPLTGQ